MEEILKKIKEARELKGYSQTEVATKLGLGLRQYQNIESGQFPKFKRQQITDLEKVLGIEIYKYVYAEKYEENDSAGLLNDQPSSYTEKRRTQKNAHSIYLVPFVDIPAQAGYTKAYSNIDYIATLKHYPILPDVDPTGATWRYFQVAGDSMEPEIRSGDTILASFVVKEDWLDIKDYYTYVVVSDDDLLIKDVYKESKESWILLSQNPKHKPKRIRIEDVKQLWVLRRHIKNRINKTKLYDLSEIKKQLK